MFNFQQKEKVRGQIFWRFPRFFPFSESTLQTIVIGLRNQQSNSIQFSQIWSDLSDHSDLPTWLKMLNCFSGNLGRCVFVVQGIVPSQALLQSRQTRREVRLPLIIFVCFSLRRLTNIRLFCLLCYALCLGAIAVSCAKWSCPQIGFFAFPIAIETSTSNRQTDKAERWA